MKLGTVLGCSLVALVTACGVDTGEAPVDESDNSIVGGQAADPGEYPGTIALQINGRFACGGALISDEWVVTAGHCVDPRTAATAFSVIVGRHKMSSTDGEVIKAKKAIRHAGYNGNTLDNDIALLQLERKTTAETVKLVSADQAAALAEGDDTITVGWGATSEGGRVSDVLQEVTVPVIGNATCKTFSRYDKVTANQICAGFPEGKKDSCQGDSGGPLFQKVDGKLVEIGLVSWGIGCARAKAPGVYTRLGNYLGWITENTGGAVR